MRRAIAALALVVVLGTMLAGCADQAPAVGVTRRGGAVVVRYKPCEAADRIQRLDLYGPGSASRPVWSARLRTGASGRTEVAVAPTVAGYQVSDHLGAAGMAPSATYSFDARSTAGAAWGGPDVRPDRLVAGQVRVAGQTLDYATWSRRPVDCPHITFLRAGSAGFVVAAAAAALILGARWILRGIARRRPVAAEPPGP
ncbi:MAG TPA: hypothetical protein VGM93_13660 [Acidimicrobiales bacterium]